MCGFDPLRRHHLSNRMAFKEFSSSSQGVQLLQRSLARGRLGHAYLFTGDALDELEALAANLAKTLNCLQPQKTSGVATDCCDECLNCRKVADGNHADVFWIRPESKSRVIKTEQIARRPDSPPRVAVEFANLKPTEAEYKVCVIVAADRLQTNAANAFLKTLEEPPKNCVIILLSTEPARILETILSRCLRLNFATGAARPLAAEQSYWLQQFSSAAANAEKSLFGRYRLLDSLLQKLSGIREKVEEALSARSPLEKYADAEKELREKWEEELKAAIEAEYRRQRAEILLLLQWWFRDVWLHTLAAGEELLHLPQIAGADEVARRISTRQARENLAVIEQTQRLLHTNVQEALALEVGLLKLQL
jgi:DNA polymerase III subunit delta'